MEAYGQITADRRSPRRNQSHLGGGMQRQYRTRTAPLDRAAGNVQDRSRQTGHSDVAKYDPLETYLKRRAGTELELSFVDIERIIGAMLPNRASRSQWWANETNPASRHVQCHAWRNAGYDAVLLPRERVLFTRRTA